jgi:hypothetical protein
MAHKSTIFAAVAVFGCVLVFSSNSITASAPVTCSPVPGAPKPPGDPKPPPVSKPPAAPSGVRIITGLASAILREFFDVVQARGLHTYFDILAARSDCNTAYSLRSQPELDMLPTGAVSEKKKPILYDPVMDAARITIHPPTSADSQQKSVPVKIDRGTALLTWDFRFDEKYRFLGEGHVARHKTWRLDPGPWIALKTDYASGANKGGGALAELLVNVPGAKFIPPGSSRDGETLLPRRSQFFFNENTWVRVWLYVEGLGGEVVNLSVWAADESRDPVLLYDRNPLYSPELGMHEFLIEYDTSADAKPFPTTDMHSWNRNVVALRDIPRAAVPALLQRPTR